MRLATGLVRSALRSCAVVSFVIETDTQAYQQQQQYNANRGYAPAPQGYYYQPRPQYQPRGLFTYQE